MLTVREFRRLAASRGIKLPQTTARRWFSTGALPGVARDKSHGRKRYLIPLEEAKKEIAIMSAANSEAAKMVSRKSLAASLGMPSSSIIQRMRSAASAVGEKPKRLGKAFGKMVFVSKPAEAALRKTQEAWNSTLSVTALAKSLRLGRYSLSYRIERGYIPAQKVLGEARVSKLLFGILGKIWGMRPIVTAPQRRRFVESCVAVLDSAAVEQENLVYIARRSAPSQEQRLVLELREILEERRRLNAVAGSLVKK